MKSDHPVMAGLCAGIIPFVLNQFYHLQGSSQSLVVDYGTLVQFSQPAIGYEGQRTTISQELDSAIRYCQTSIYLPWNL